MLAVLIHEQDPAERLQEIIYNFNTASKNLIETIDKLEARLQAHFDSSDVNSEKMLHATLTKQYEEFWDIVDSLKRMVY